MIVAVLFMSVGLMFLVYPHIVTKASDQQVTNRLFVSRWIGGSLVAICNEVE